MSGGEWIIGLVVLGTLLICVEMFVPGMILGLIGGGCLAVAVIIAFRQMGLRMGGMVLMGEAVVVAVLFSGWIYFLPRSPMAKWMMLRETNTARGGNALGQLAGKEGTAQTICRPAGIALIDGRRYDVVSESVFVEAGARVRVVNVEGKRVVVRPLPPG